MGSRPFSAAAIASTSSVDCFGNGPQFVIFPSYTYFTMPPTSDPLVLTEVEEGSPTEAEVLCNAFRNGFSGCWTGLGLGFEQGFWF